MPHSLDGSPNSEILRGLLKSASRGTSARSAWETLYASAVSLRGTASLVLVGSKSPHARDEVIRELTAFRQRLSPKHYHSAVGRTGSPTP